MTGPSSIKKKGDIVEGYRVMSEVGRGAASIIYLVQDPKTKQIWALKHLQKHNAKEQRFLDQAEQEYKIARDVKHPAVRQIPRLIKKGGLLSTKELYLVMEFVDGVALDQYELKDLEQTLVIFEHVAGGLQAMHQHGYVHADMKPLNIIIATTLDGEVSAKIIDLGQSCKIGTVKKRIQGTPDYIAPEQVRLRTITPQTDIYNLGASIYWCLTGKKVPTAMGVKPDSLVNSIDDSLIERPVPISELRPDVPIQLCDLVMDMVEVDPDRRPRSMAFVADRLNLVLGICRAQASIAPINDD